MTGALCHVCTEIVPLILTLPTPSEKEKESPALVLLILTLSDSETLTILTMYSFKCYFCNVKYIALYTANNKTQSKQISASKHLHREREREREGGRERERGERHRERGGDILLHNDIDLSTSRFFTYQSLMTNTATLCKRILQRRIRQYIKEEYN